MNDVNHFRRFMLIWVLASVIATPLVVFVLAPGLPPGNGAVQGAGQVTDNTVLLGLSTPVALGVGVFVLYALIAFRERDPAAALEGPAVRGHAGAQIWWIVTSGVLVLFLAGYGTVRMLEDGAGGGQGPNPIAKPDASAGKPLQVQVIAQQWQFTYRFPQYGGVETAQLELPAGRMIEFHVTSLDAIHSFWAYQLGVKADANPGIDNIAYVQTKKPMRFDIHCAELCGLWHGYMSDHAAVVPSSQFVSWVRQRQVQYAPVQKSLPPYSTTYFPDPQRRGG